MIRSLVWIVAGFAAAAAAIAAWRLVLTWWLTRPLVGVDPDTGAVMGVRITPLSPAETREARETESSALVSAVWPAL